MMAEKGLPDLTIMAQVGHVSPAMTKTYSHIRHQALNQAAAALEPNFPSAPAVPEMVN
jgi:integrase